MPATITAAWRVLLERRENRRCLVWSAALFIFVVLMLVTPRIPQDQSYHNFADKRNYIGIPNTLNVVSNFPYLIIGVIGLVLCFHGNHFGLRTKGEFWAWAFFFIGVTATSFGSAYYHLNPNDSTLVWDRLPMTIAFSSVMALFIIERIDEKTGTASIAPLLLIGAASVAYWRFADDLRPYALVQFVPCFAIPAMAIALPPKYTHSVYWLWAAGWYLLAKIEEALDSEILNLTYHTVSGHTLKHLCSAMVPVFVIIMLLKRDVDSERQTLWEQWTVQIKMRYFVNDDEQLQSLQVRINNETEERQALVDKSTKD